MTLTIEFLIKGKTYGFKIDGCETVGFKWRVSDQFKMCLGRTVQLNIKLAWRSIAGAGSFLTIFANWWIKPESVAGSRKEEG